MNDRDNHVPFVDGAMADGIKVTAKELKNPTVRREAQPVPNPKRCHWRMKGMRKN